MPMGRIKNWASFQHYKDRAPPWIKLHKSILDDFNYSRLPIASKALAPLLWLLASESNDGSVEVSPEWLAFRLRWNEADVRSGLTPLIDSGFVLVDSASLAECLQDACPEREGETEREEEGEKGSSAAPSGAPPALLPEEPPAILIPSTGGKEVPITRDAVAEFREAYPAVDVMAELRAMRAWAIANKAKRKTPNGMLRFVNSWLSKAQNAPPRQFVSAPPSNSSGYRPMPGEK